MPNATSIVDRYQQRRAERFLKYEQAYANWLPTWRTQRRRRMLVVGLALTFAVMAGVSIVCAFGLRELALIWVPATVVFFVLWLMLQIVSGRQGDAPLVTLDEFELAQRNNARSIGLTVTQNLMLLPIFYLIIGSVLTDFGDGNIAYAGGLMTITVLLIGGCLPAMILGWTRPDPDA
ncbi:hypothetical protein ACAG25_18670 [Mycobacterium sp. pV006]|uniref:hypothetical protein n=1 Tax=Mycobacterium sp. pV006 TaxID=3238983 RepID=UPI00351B2B1C